MAGTKEGAAKREAKFTKAYKKSRAAGGGRAKGRKKREAAKVLSFIPEVNDDLSSRSIEDMTSEEAFEQLRKELSPGQTALWRKRLICRIADEGGTAGIAALKEFREFLDEFASMMNREEVVSYSIPNESDTGVG